MFQTLDMLSYKSEGVIGPQICRHGGNEQWKMFDHSFSKSWFHCKEPAMQNLSCRVLTVAVKGLRRM